MDDISFIILRHVGSPKDNIYWNICYDKIRNIYKNEHIYIIDDNSKFPPYRINNQMINTTIIKSELPPNRGELLPYYYYYNNKFSKNAIFLHDTVFIHKKIDEKLLNTKSYHFLWIAPHDWDPKKNILNILKKMDNSKKLIRLFKRKNAWDVCFGGMSILNYNYMKTIFDNNNYFEILLNEINNRNTRMSFERIISLLLTNNCKNISVNGDIHIDQKWGMKINEYNELKKIDKNMYKIWVGRKGI